MSIIAHWTDASDDASNTKWARDVWSATQPYVMPAVFMNHMTADESQDRVRSAYGEEKYAKLTSLKSKYDPTNVFRLTTILPANVESDSPNSREAANHSRLAIRNGECAPERIDNRTASASGDSHPHHPASACI